ncbi:hypothetical protein [Chamaesiphon sp.]|uniref:hypothetical protein n=1 Tax=Chamaesiphon sp. TaxID=2814140 RepID=UPI0035930517
MSQPIDPNRVVIFSGAGISLHERAGSSNIIHAHGEITKARSSIDSSLIYPIGERSIQL